MTRDEGIELGKYLAGMIPTMTNTQKLEALDEFIKHPDPVVVKARIAEYARANESFNLARMVLLLNRGVDQVQKTQTYMEAQRAAARQARADFDLAMDVVASLTDEQLEAEKQLALTMIGGVMATKKQNANARTDPLLVGVIAEHVKSRGGVVEEWSEVKRG